MGERPFLRRRLVAGAVILLAWLVATARPARAESRVFLITADGVSIAATYYEPTRRPAPMVLLVHMPTRTRADWAWIAPRFVDRGVGVLAIDLRGAGDSGPPTYTAAGAEDRGAAVRDVMAALTWLRQRPEAMPGAIGIVGASLGANLAALAAADDPTVRALVLLSPTTDFRGVRPEPALRKLGPRPMLLMTSSEDSYATRSAREFAAAAPDTREHQVADGAGHGTAMLLQRPDLVATLVDWLCSRLL